MTAKKIPARKAHRQPETIRSAPRSPASRSDSNAARHAAKILSESSLSQGSRDALQATVKQYAKALKRLADQ
jgi:hypothetical protein